MSDRELRRTPPPRPRWPLRQEPPPLTTETIHVWSATAVLDPLEMALFRGLLPEEERARCERFRFRGDRLRYTVGRGLLRTLAAAYTGQRPEAIRVRVEGNTKPSLDLSRGAPDLRFNLAHSGALILCAFALGEELGVDVEVARPIAEREGIVRRCFAPEERAALAFTPEQERDRAFLRAWTRKEAVMKATGKGLALALDRVRVCTAARRDPFSVRLAERKESSPRSWRVQPLAPAADYEAAVACASANWRVEVFHHEHRRAGNASANDPQ